MLTKCSFTRDGWEHILRLLNIMNSSMFSCSHFLSNRKQSVMSKRVQESTLKEGSAVAKQRPMNLVSKNLLSAKKDPPRDLGDPNSLGNQDFGSELCFSSRKEIAAQHEPEPNTVFSREARGEDYQFGKSKLHFHKMQISDYRYLEKVFKNLQKKLNLAEDAPPIGIEALKTNVLIWGSLMSTSMKAAIHMGQNCNETLEVYRNTNLEELQNLFHFTQELYRIIKWRF